MEQIGSDLIEAYKETNLMKLLLGLTERFKVWNILNPARSTIFSLVLVEESIQREWDLVWTIDSTNSLQEI